MNWEHAKNGKNNNHPSVKTPKKISTDPISALKKMDGGGGGGWDEIEE